MGARPAQAARPGPFRPGRRIGGRASRRPCRPAGADSERGSCGPPARPGPLRVSARATARRRRGGVGEFQVGPPDDSEQATVPGYHHWQATAGRATLRADVAVTAGRRGLGGRGPDRPGPPARRRAQSLAGGAIRTRPHGSPLQPLQPIQPSGCRSRQWRRLAAAAGSGG